MLPIGDEEPTRTTPIVNWLLIAVCFIIFLWQISGGYRFFIYTLYTYGLIPARLMMGEGYYTLLTNMFLHGGWMHLLGNMFFLYIFGDNVEDACGHVKYLIFYILCGVAASLFWLATSWGSQYPAVGASGAISGVMGAYFVLYPEARIRALVRFGFFWQIIRLPAYLMLGLWFLYQLFLAMIPLNLGVAYWAHVGGFITGLALGRVFGTPRRSRIYYLYY